MWVCEDEKEEIDQLDTARNDDFFGFAITFCFGPVFGALQLTSFSAGSKMMELQQCCNKARTNLSLWGMSILSTVGSMRVNESNACASLANMNIECWWTLPLAVEKCSGCKSKFRCTGDGRYFHSEAVYFPG
jgi:hypothetical protein